MTSSSLQENASESDAGRKPPDLAHPLFSTPELTSAIVDNLEGRKNLFALALVSHAFSEPALDALWQKLRTFKNFINLIPEGARGEKVTKGHILRCFQDDDGDDTLFYKDAVRPSVMVV